jgi:hypothetical protein
MLPCAEFSWEALPELAKDRQQVTFEAPRMLAQTEAMRAAAVEDLEAPAQAREQTARTDSVTKETARSVPEGSYLESGGPVFDAGASITILFSVLPRRRRQRQAGESALGVP